MLNESDADSDRKASEFLTVKGLTIQKDRKKYSRRLRRHKDAILGMYAPNPEKAMMITGSAD